MNDHLLIGSVVWQEQAETRADRNFRRRNIRAEIRRIYAENQSFVVNRINSPEETETGHVLHHRLINHTDLNMALRGLTEFRQTCFVAHVIAGHSVAAIARNEGRSEQNIERAIDSACDDLARYLYERRAA